MILTVAITVLILKSAQIAYCGNVVTGLADTCNHHFGSAPVHYNYTANPHACYIFTSAAYDYATAATM
jgi:hypothetical protein